MSKEEILTALGVNIRETMERFMNNEELYMRFLKKFYGDENFMKLGESLRNEDYDGAEQYSHTLKGVTANLGLDRLYQQLIEIVNKLRAGETENLMDLFETFEQEYTKTCQLIDQLQ